MLFSFILGFSISMMCCLLFTPVAKRVALFCGAVDNPDQRKIHQFPTPRLGGLAVFCSAVLSLCALALLSPDLVASSWIHSGQGIALGCCLIIIVGLGSCDDIRPLSPQIKLIVELFVATLAYCAGFSFSESSFLPMAYGGWLGDYVVSVLWIIGVTNAVNLVDGLDGLASGISLIACLTILPLAFMNHDIGTILVALVLAGGLLGFLFYNFNPAAIFLGDSGSLVLGFSLAILSMKCAEQIPHGLSSAVPVLMLGVPVGDTVLSIIRRFFGSFEFHRMEREGMVDRLRLVLRPDRNHIHHKLISLGLTQRQVVCLLCGASALLGIGAVAITFVSSQAAWFITIAFIATSIVGIRRLGYQELALIKNGVLLEVCRLIFQRGRGIMLIDSVFIIVSLLASHLLSMSGKNVHFSPDLFISFAVTVMVQFLAFQALGLYKNLSPHFGLDDIWHLLKITILSVAASGVFAAVVPLSFAPSDISVLVTDFYLLLTLMLMSRSSVRLLEHRIGQTS